MAPYFFEEDLASRRAWVLSEGRVGTFDGTAIRDERYKLLVMNGREEFYDVEADPNEFRPLALQTLSGEARSAYDRLRQQLDSVMPE